LVSFVAIFILKKKEKERKCKQQQVTNQHVTKGHSISECKNDQILVTKTQTNEQNFRKYRLAFVLSHFGKNKENTQEI
jgi:hypothetical protein